MKIAWRVKSRSESPINHCILQGQAECWLIWWKSKQYRLIVEYVTAIDIDVRLGRVKETFMIPQVQICQCFRLGSASTV